MSRFLRWRRLAALTFALVTVAITGAAYRGTSAGAAVKPHHVCVVYDLLVHGKTVIAAKPLAVVPCPGASSTSAGAA